MGSKQALSNGNEAEELTDLVAAFELHNKCKITFYSSLKLRSGYLDLEWQATALETDRGDPEATGKVLANVSLWAGGYKTLKGLLSRLLYALDFQLAEKEFAKVVIK